MRNCSAKRRPDNDDWLPAGRIAALDRVCHQYRIGRPGAITATRSDRHFEAFDQYDRYRRHRPAGHLPPSGMTGLKHQLVASGAYPVYALLRVGYRVAGRGRRKPGRPPSGRRVLSLPGYGGPGGRLVDGEMNAVVWSERGK
ncbi:hypothetical protein [Paractinoplanes globisporus]|uniref:Transposase n=1 Tax=Paractinoplanes globisporus TaxID=113565 RepID=A0ABW6WWL9_9ACTN|nr:hypothetical protein [Actinoplanes globisporus]